MEAGKFLVWLTKRKNRAQARSPLFGLTTLIPKAADAQIKFSEVFDDEGAPISFIR